MDPLYGNNAILNRRSLPNHDLKYIWIWSNDLWESEIAYRFTTTSKEKSVAFVFITSLVHKKKLANNMKWICKPQQIAIQIID